MFNSQHTQILNVFGGKSRLMFRTDKSSATVLLGGVLHF